MHEHMAKFVGIHGEHVILALSPEMVVMLHKVFNTNTKHLEMALEMPECFQNKEDYAMFYAVEKAKEALNND